MVWRWASDASLVDPYAEFCVVQRRGPGCQYEPGAKRLSSIKFQDNVDEDDFVNSLSPSDVWHNTFYVNPSRVPIFVSSDTATKILNCGKARSIIKLFQRLESTTLRASAIYFQPSNFDGPETRGGSAHLYSSHTAASSTNQQRSCLHDDCSDSDISQVRPTSNYRSRVGVTTPDDSPMSCSSSVKLNGGSPTIWDRTRNRETVVERRRALVTGHSSTMKNRNCSSTNDPIGYVLNTLGPAANSLLLLGTFGPTFDFNDRATEVTKARSDEQLSGPDIQGDGFRNLEDMTLKIRSMQEDACLKIILLLVHRYHLLSHCEAIRKFLLLGQGDFIAEMLSQFSPSSQAFVAVTGQQQPMCWVQSLTGPIGTGCCNLSQLATNITPQHLRACLQMAIISSNAQFFPQEVLNRFDIRKLENEKSENSHRIGWEVVTFDYITDGSPVSLVLTESSMAGYRLVHSLLWKIHHASSSLGTVWLLNLRLLKRRRSFATANDNKKDGSTFSSRQQPRYQRYGVTLLDTADELTRLAIHQCEALYIEKTHFLRNILSFLMYEVIEPSWMLFVRQMNCIVASRNTSEEHPSSMYRMVKTEGWNTSSRTPTALSMVDRVIASHDNYVTTMLHGTFILDAVDGCGIKEPPCTTKVPLPSAIDMLAMTEGNDAIEPEVKRVSMIQLLLRILDIILQFCTLSESIFAVVHREQSELLARQAVSTNTLPEDRVLFDNTGGATEESRSLNFLVECLNTLSSNYAYCTIEFLKQLNLTAKSNKMRDFTESNIGGVGGVNYTEALRSLLLRLDFNNYYGADMELYRTSRIASIPGCPHLSRIDTKQTTLARGISLPVSTDVNVPSLNLLSAAPPSDSTEGTESSRSYSSEYSGTSSSESGRSRSGSSRSGSSRSEESNLDTGHRS